MSTKQCLEETRSIRVLAEILVPQDEVEEDQAPECEDSDIEEEIAITDLRDRNQRYLQPVMQTPKWKVQSYPLQNGEQVQVIISPKASHMNYKLLHPSFYCDVNNLGDLNDLAALVNAPTDWEQTYDRLIATNESVIGNFNLLQGLPDFALEANVSAQFAQLVASMAQLLHVLLSPLAQTPITVGGLLLDKSLFLRSDTDVHFSKNGSNVIATELKAANAFPAVWYRGSCGIQALAAMYAHRCATFVASQKQWKLIVQNRNRDGILTYPFEAAAATRAGSTGMKALGPTFLKAICICILSAPDGAAVGSGTSVSEAKLIPATPEATKPGAPGSLEQAFKKARRGETGGSEPRSGDGASKSMRCPSGGGPANQGVRVLSEGDVRAIEGRIAAEERARASARLAAEAGTDVAAA
jgi:hypothetical protein